MKNKAKLAFDLLEMEMQILSSKENFKIKGGGDYAPQEGDWCICDGQVFIWNSSYGCWEGQLGGMTITVGSSGNNWNPESYGLSSSGYHDYDNYTLSPPRGGGGGNSEGSGGSTGQWGVNQFFNHYNNGNGEPVKLSDMGLKDNVINSDTYLQMMINVNNQIENYVHNQVALGSNYTGTFEFTWNFNNSYNFTADSGLFPIGSATISGDFSGQFTIDDQGKINVDGYLYLNFHDSFEDPWDLFNLTDGSWDPYGTPYDINDTWDQQILMENIVP